MFRLIWIASIHLAGFFRRVMPTNILLDKIRTRTGLKWGVPAMLVAIPYLYAASLLTVIIQDGGPVWLNILVLIPLWSALKMLWIGPISLVLLVRARWRELTNHKHDPETTHNAAVEGAPTACGLAGRPQHPEPQVEREATPRSGRNRLESRKRPDPSGCNKPAGN